MLYVMSDRRRTLEGWQEIADYLARATGLHVTVHRARGWEKKLALPVHRLGLPYAYVDEVDAWIDAHSARPARAG